MQPSVKNDPMSLSKVNIAIGRRGRMYIPRLPIGEYQNLDKEGFVRRFFSMWNSKYAVHFDIKTENPEDLPPVQCHLGARRSLGDITLILRHYYPKTTIIEVREILRELVRKQYLQTYICPTVKRRVYWCGSGGDMSNGYRDEFGWTYNEEVK
jgi:hypothetical protein